MKLRTVMAAVLSFALSAAALAQPLASLSGPALKARPSPTGASLAPGETSLVNGAVAYRPPAAPAGPLPVLVLLHGAGGYPSGFVQKMEPVADRLGLILVAPHSVGETWDLVEKMQAGEAPRLGPDARRLDQSLADLFGRTAADPAHVVLLGFSDGASYALSIGLYNPKLFTAIIALSPGIFALPTRVDRTQRVFIAHGRSDDVLPFAMSSDIADGLRRSGANVRFRPFDGSHRIDPEALTEALEWTFGGSALQH